MHCKSHKLYLFMEPTLLGHFSLWVTAYGVGALPKRGSPLWCTCNQLYIGTEEYLCFVEHQT